MVGQFSMPIDMLPGKSMASGETRLAGFDFDSKDSFAP
jgi:hypothetical protein